MKVYIAEKTDPKGWRRPVESYDSASHWLSNINNLREVVFVHDDISDLCKYTDDPDYFVSNYRINDNSEEEIVLEFHFGERFPESSEGATMLLWASDILRSSDTQ